MARGDRKDGKLLRDLDSLHFVTGIIYPNRCDNEAFISERVDLTNINKYLEKKNEENKKLIAEGKAPDYKYNLFQLIVTALLKTLYLRPKMNRFIVNDNFYQRNEVSASFVVKKLFDDNGAEALAFVHSSEDDTLDSVHQKIYDQVAQRRSDDDNGDASTDSMDIFNKLPRWLSKAAIHFVMWLDKHGWVPQSLIATDPYYSSVVISNLGSIKMKSGYHHLTNWGTCSMILLIGEMKNRPYFNDDGTFEMRPSVDLGLTIDERLADGYYYSKTLKLIRKLLENPELLEQTMLTEVDY
ncbi:MAG: 2-oxo acid dehydrogenase subunit E2 [Bacillota bacterium]|nr:2-oxo acid dehydrogenase subunit E2 [Bacillota bacterium]